MSSHGTEIFSRVTRWLFTVVLVVGLCMSIKLVIYELPLTFRQMTFLTAGSAVGAAVAETIDFFMLWLRERRTQQGVTHGQP